MKLKKWNLLVVAFVVVMLSAAVVILIINRNVVLPTSDSFGIVDETKIVTEDERFERMNDYYKEKENDVLGRTK